MEVTKWLKPSDSARVRQFPALPNRLLTVAELADYADVDPRTIRNATCDGGLKAVAVGGVYRVLPSDFFAYISRRFCRRIRRRKNR
jgi:excisionase family DNA binding protein